MAGVARTSRSAFHAHFNVVTAMSPFEFRTQLWMQEARRLKVAEEMNAASAGVLRGI
jgi:AraC-like DNA-binding protein